jgi:hypothetical protein
VTSFSCRVLSPTLKSCEQGKYRERWSEDLERVAAQAADFYDIHSVTAENIVLGKDGKPTSLDIYGQFSPTSSKVISLIHGAKNRNELIIVLYRV